MCRSPACLLAGRLGEGKGREEIFAKQCKDNTLVVEPDPSDVVAQLCAPWCWLADHCGRVTPTSDTKRHNFDSAFQDFSEVIRRKPDCEAAYRFRIIADLHRDDLLRAVDDCNALARLKPKEPWACLVRARIRWKQGKLDQAVADFTETLRTKPNFVVAHYYRGRVYAQKGDLDRAVADFTQAIDSGNQNTYSILALHKRGEVYQQRGEKALAEKDIQRAKKATIDDMLLSFAEADIFP
jgi:tetratricopeptide (TPR) repeat protein